MNKEDMNGKKKEGIENKAEGYFVEAFLAQAKMWKEEMEGNIELAMAAGKKAKEYALKAEDLFLMAGNMERLQLVIRFVGQVNEEVKEIERRRAVK